MGSRGKRVCHSGEEMNQGWWALSAWLNFGEVGSKGDKGGTYGKAQRPQMGFEQCEVERMLVAGRTAQFHEEECAAC